MKTLATTLLALAAAGIVVAAGPACAADVPSAAAKLVPAASEIGFTSKQMGVPVEGRFKRFEAQVQFDPKRPETGSIALVIDLASVALGGPELEDELAKPDWFDTKKAATARFQSTSIKATGPAKFDVAGRLTIKGNMRELTVPVVLTQAGTPTTTTAAGSFVLKRLDFHIGDGDWADPAMVANDVQVRFKLVLTGMRPL